MNKKRKAAIRGMLVRNLEACAKEIYHNATIRWPSADKLPKDIGEYLSEERQWEEVQFALCARLNDVNAGIGDKEYIEGYIAEKYGEVYTYGRGGRTCAPHRWVIGRGGSSFSISSFPLEDRPRRDIIKVTQDILRWNMYVAAECSADAIVNILSHPYQEAKGAAAEELIGKVEALIQI
jgi:hypothetical protein